MTGKGGIVRYPKGTKPVVIEARIEELIDRKSHVGTTVIKEGVGIRKETDIPAIVKLLREKTKNEVPADTKVEFSIYFLKTRKRSSSLRPSGLLVDSFPTLDY